ncbi:MAG: GNAT family N-acetyltransferase [Chitinophagaceae bacterium]
MQNKQSAEHINYKLRDVIGSDIVLLFEWVNDNQVRGNSINNQPISFGEHTEWFNEKINSPICKMFILEINNEPAGQIRFEFNDIERVWEIDYSISKKFRGLGLGKLIVKKSIHLVNQFSFAAYVKEDNIRSQNVFSGLGFTNMGLHKIKNTKLLKYFKVQSNE